MAKLINFTPGRGFELQLEIELLLEEKEILLMALNRQIDSIILKELDDIDKIITIKRKQLESEKGIYDDLVEKRILQKANNS